MGIETHEHANGESNGRKGWVPRPELASQREKARQRLARKLREQHRSELEEALGVLRQALVEVAVGRRSIADGQVGLCVNFISQVLADMLGLDAFGRDKDEARQAGEVDRDGVAAALEAEAVTL